MAYLEEDCEFILYEYRKREKVNRKDKIMVVSFLNSQFEKAIVQFLRGHNDNEQY